MAAVSAEGAGPGMHGRGKAGSAESAQRRRSAWALLAVHAVAFVVLLFGFILRIDALRAEGTSIDPVVIVDAVILTVVFAVGLSVVLTLRRRSRPRRAITAAGAGDATVFCYWSRVNNPPFLARSGLRASGRGLDAAVTATADGVRVRLLERRRLVDFGPIPWSALGEVGESAKEVGVGVTARGGVLTIRTARPVSPYARLMEFFPLGETAAVGAARLSASDPRNRS
ncbi:hypothetical protein [Leifsonia aquatica]|uniref:hypothetical protein n=1 Tax=Leifsonia aquatica TaxID=144185 RepID=UPI0038042090